MSTKIILFWTLILNYDSWYVIKSTEDSQIKPSFLTMVKQINLLCSGLCKARLYNKLGYFLCEKCTENVVS